MRWGTRGGLALLLVAFVGLGACSSFDSASEPTSDDGGTPGVDTGVPPVTGTPSRGLTVTVGAPNATAFVMQGRALALPITLVRMESSQEAVTVTVHGLPPKVTADPLVIPAGALTGTLTLHAD